MVKNPTALKRAGALALALCAGSALADARLEARRHFRNGMSLIEQGQYDDGISELLEAYAIKPHANVLYNIARAYQDAGRIPEAVDYYQRYLAANPPDAEPVQLTLTRLEASLKNTESAKQLLDAARPVDLGVPTPGVKKPALPPMPAPPPTAESTRALTALVERLEKAVTRAETLIPTPAPAPHPALASPTAPGPEGAPEVATAAEEEDGAVPYEERVVTASRREQSSLEAPNSTTVITAEDIRLSGATSLPELLRRVPGAEVMMMGTGSADLSFRGFNQRIANKVLVLVDGRTEYQDFLGLTLWGAIPVELDDIERIEVIRGPGSALYGANAMLGVVNIITRAPGSGPRARFQALVGGGNTASGSFVNNGGSGALRYRVTGAYGQTDKSSRDFAGDRPDISIRDPNPNLGTRTAHATLATTYQLNPEATLGLSGGVNRIYTEVYPLGVLRNFFVDGLTAFVKADADLGPMKVKAFWNHLDVLGGPQYEATGQRSLVTHVGSELFNGEVLFNKRFTLLGEHQVNVGAEVRLKRVAFDYLGGPRQEVHAAAFIQDEWRILQPLRIVASYRADRHPLLDYGKPGLAQSPRVSALFIPIEGQALRVSAATAFREPTFLESYAAVNIPIPCVNGASALSQGNPELRPGRLVALELGYRGEAPTLGVDWDVAVYQNTVYNLIQLSGLDTGATSGMVDPVTGSYLLGRSIFQNEKDIVYTARGVEVGASLAPVDGLGIKASASFQRITASGGDVCGPCTEAPQLKLYAGVTYRTREALELGVDVAYASSTVWIEREPSLQDPTQIASLANPLSAYTVVNARVGYSPVKDRVSVALIGSNLGPEHAEHPFGNRIERRVFAQLTVTP